MLLLLTLSEGSYASNVCSCKTGDIARSNGCYRRDKYVLIILEMHYLACHILLRMLQELCIICQSANWLMIECQVFTMKCRYIRCLTLLNYRTCHVQSTGICETAMEISISYLRNRYMTVYKTFQDLLIL